MKGLVTAASLLFAGAVIGWWLRDMIPERSQLQSRSPDSSSRTRLAVPSQTELSAAWDARGIDELPVPGQTNPPGHARFKELLRQQKFDQAITYYEYALQFDDGSQALLISTLQEYLTVRLYQCDDGAFVDLVDQWLGAYYEDISVLLLLAENQRFCNSPEEAARTLQIASTYAVQPGSQESVSAAVNNLIAATDESLSQQQSWIELLGFYEFLQAIDLATNASQLRRVTLYQLMGEVERSQALLLKLRENDDGLDSQWTAALELQWAKSARQPSVDEPPAHAIPLTRRGDHFLVTATINGGSQVILMIDTGASVTALSSESFRELEGAGLGYLGSRLFNTPNGRTQGEVYQAESIALGNTRLSAVEIAVLDYMSSVGVDGLLGMNVLRNYRFQIDQDENLLYLRPR